MAGRNKAALAMLEMAIETLQRLQSTMTGEEKPVAVVKQRRKRRSLKNVADVGGNSAQEAVE